MHRLATVTNSFQKRSLRGRAAIIMAASRAVLRTLGNPHKGPNCRAPDGSASRYFADPQSGLYISECLVGEDRAHRNVGIMVPVPDDDLSATSHPTTVFAYCSCHGNYQAHSLNGDEPWVERMLELNSFARHQRRVFPTRRPYTDPT